MSKTNKKIKIDPVYTHGGAVAYSHVKPEEQLRRSVLSCFLWEDEFYEDGTSIAKRIHDAANACPVSVVADLAIEARTRFNLRHAPLWLLLNVIERGRGTSLPSDTIERVIRRADELGELIALYRTGGRKPLSAQLKKGLARAFHNFDEYQLAKYNRDVAVKMRDVLRMVHPKPRNEDEAALWGRVIKSELATPDTWEVALSSGADKRATWERLLDEGKLGHLALLRNLRNMEQARVPHDKVFAALRARKGGAGRVLPFRYIAASKHAPWAEKVLDEALVASLKTQPRLMGHTLVVIDVSGSMVQQLSGKSDMSRLDAAASLAGIITGVSDDCSVWLTAGNDGTRQHRTKEVAARPGGAMRDLVRDGLRTMGGGGIFLTPCLRYIVDNHKRPVDRLIVITDEQDCAVADRDKPTLAEPFGTHNYLLNVGSYKNGIGYGKWVHVDGFSERVVDYMIERETGEGTWSSSTQQ